MFAVRPLMLPWVAVALVGGVICFALDMTVHLSLVGRAMVIAPFFFVGLVGMTYAGWVILYYGIRADVRRMNEARAKES